MNAMVVAEVYWRPGCPFCSRLRRGLARRGVDARWHNIWDEEDAREYVRTVNGGNETVPTVRIGDRALTNPRAAQVAALLPIQAGGIGRASSACASAPGSRVCLGSDSPGLRATRTDVGGPDRSPWRPIHLPRDDVRPVIGFPL